MKNIRLLCLLVLLTLGTILHAQVITEFQKNFQLDIHPTTDHIVLDGVLEEGVWKSAVVAKNFTKK
jgi:hypothetical protein